MDISEHAIQRYAERSGTDPLYAATTLRQKLMSRTTARMKWQAATASGFFVRHRKKNCNDTFYVWVEPVINDLMCAVEHDGVIVTVMSRGKFSFNNGEMTKERLKTL